jgi:hypothetical protein
MRLSPLRFIDKYKIKAAFGVVFLATILSASAQVENAGGAPLLQEKFFVHTDKTCYLPGEFIWFRIYDMDGMSNQPLDFSKIAYVELLDQHNKPVLQTKTALENTSGAGSLFIPATMVSGNYILRAYSAWMKNFDAGYFFEQSIVIINTHSGSTVDTTRPSIQYDIQFFPEGGNLVEGLSSKVAFKIVDQFNNPLESEGFMINQKKDTLLHFNTLRFGAGQFLFTPKNGETYFAFLKMKDTTITVKLPAALAHGYVMHLEEAGTDQLKLSVYSNLSNPDLELSLQIESHQLTKDFQTGQLSGNKTSFLVDKKKLGEGISCITLFDAGKKPVAERLYFKRPKKTLELAAVTDKKEYTTRDKVNLDLSAIGDGAALAGTGLSMSVYQVNQLETKNYQDILSYIYLGSELKGKIISPGYYFTSSDADVQEVTDILMLTQGWRRFKFDGSKYQSNHPGEFIAELEGSLITGKVIDKRSGGVAKQIMTYLSIPGKSFQFACSLSDSSGKVLFNCPAFYGAPPVVLQTNYSIDSNYRIDLDNPFSDQFSQTSPTPFVLSKDWKKDLLQRSIEVQIENNYPGQGKTPSLPLALKDSLSFYGIPDRKYFLDDYTRFGTMEEVMREYIEGVMVRLNQGNFSYRVWNSTFTNYFYNSPLVMLDGLPVFNINKIIAFDPLKIKKIEVVTKKYFLGSSISEGIISYSTYNGDLAGFPIDPNCIVVDYQGLEEEREFYAPRYDNEEQKESRLPDVRNVLYWAPDLKMDSTGKTSVNFYTSDLQGKFLIVLQGLSGAGLAGTATAGFEVLESKK